ncbi:hypothetical protein [Marinomonas rhizomae]|uniref:Uncharacterized protein n=1 Tax=Marinomonas rhizomae TaxID=491948 RepID=A0A366J5V4_9GAMM|nr:hypothetical protein [Marinomonas rhizomae]RBP82416.1 hypothetical protein DFP80_10862 [Marinomonas rhizomae]
MSWVAIYRPKSQSADGITVGEKERIDEVINSKRWMVFFVVQHNFAFFKTIG